MAQPAFAESGTTNTLDTEQLFAQLHHQLAAGYRDPNGEYYASCVDIAVDLADSIIRAGGSPSYLRLAPVDPDSSTAKYLRPRVYGGRVEWTDHVAVLDSEGLVLDPFLPAPVTVDEYTGHEFMDGNVRITGTIEGDEAKSLTAAELKKRRLGIF